jgi:hypothetical protein
VHDLIFFWEMVFHGLEALLLQKGILSLVGCFIGFNFMLPYTGGIPNQIQISISTT